MEVENKVFKKGDNEDFRLVQPRTTVNADFIELVRLWNQLLVATEHFRREESLSPGKTKTMLKFKDQQLRVAHKTVDAVAFQAEKLCESTGVNADKSESSHA